MSKLPSVKAKDLVKALCRNYFYIHHTKGSHVHLLHEFKTYMRVVVPIHGKELAPKTLKTILAQTEISVEELKKML
ncbi:MAG: type II toxin-antitoxin system HicA family toxin [Patescibacteria group bacterium]